MAKFIATFCAVAVTGGAFLGLNAATAVAQSSSMFGSNSPSNRSASGMSSMGGTNFNGMSGGSGSTGSVFGSSAFGSNSMMGGANSRTGTGTNANGRNATGTNQGNFIGRNVNPNQFIGGNNQIGGTLNQQNQRRQGNRNRDNNDNNPFNENGGRNGSNSAPALRAQQKIGFEVPRLQPQRKQAELQSRFVKLTESKAAMRGVSVATEEDGSVVLQGDVVSASVAKLAEKLVRLEPGVSSVRNELSYPAD